MNGQLSSDFAADIDRLLGEFFDRQTDRVTELGAEFTDAVAILRSYVLRGGKRVRPQFAWLGWIAAGGEHDGARAAAVKQACTAIELIHACALIHDDVIDASATRRGMPTVHVEFANLHRARQFSRSADEFGTSSAILLGDLALCWAEDMLQEAGLDADARQRIQPIWRGMRTEVLGGQYLDIYNEVSATESVTAAARVNRFKTAAYTIERPLQLGAALANADPKMIDALRLYGADIGVAFQLRDDLLGVFGDPTLTGKPSGDDLRTGKRTALIAEALARADIDDASTLRTKLGTALTEAEVCELREILRRVGAVNILEAQIAELTAKGVAALGDCGLTPEVQTRLVAFAQAATARHA